MAGHAGRVGMTSLLGPGLVLVAWGWLSSTGLVSLQILPPPAQVWDTAHELLFSGELTEATRATLQRVSVGFLFGALFGVALGIALASSSLLDRFGGPVLYALLQIPGLVWVPALIAIFGIGESFKWASITLTVLFPVASNSYEAIRGIHTRYLELGAVLCLPRRLRIRSILLPAVLPRLFVGLRVGMSKAWLVVVFVELFAASSGLGYLMDQGRTTFRMDVVLVAVLVTGVLGYAMDQVLARAATYCDYRPTRT